MSVNPSVTVERNDTLPRLSGQAERSYQELWLGLSRREWRSLVLVPADPRGSAADIARALAEVGKHLSDIPVSAITIGALQYESALALAELQQRTDREKPVVLERAPLVEVTATPVVDEDDGDPKWASIPRAHGGERLELSPATRLVISIPPVVSEPLGLAVAERADAIVVCVERGRTRLADVRRTAEMIGRDRVAGCFLVR
jgi:hypothetical protein